VRRVLRDDGTLWLNLGDSYVSNPISKGGVSEIRIDQETGGLQKGHARRVTFRGNGLKAKDLIGIPWKVALALQTDGWYLRQDIIWHKPNPMPESVRDRCTKSHEYIFLLSKSQKYHYDHLAIMEPAAQSSLERLSQPTLSLQVGSERVPGKVNGNMKAVGGDMRNKRSVWTVTTQPFSGAHFATFPPKLIEPCILAGCPVGGTVLDPFGGSGTTGMVATQHRRNAILIELNPAYIELQRQRTSNIQMSLV
jgi:DNA modification methylase